VRAGRDGIRRNDVAGSAAANRVHWCVVFVEEAVALELLVETEDGAFASGTDVAGSAAAAKKAMRMRVGESGRWWGEGSRLEAVVVTGAAAARGVVTASGAEGRGLSDDSHFIGSSDAVGCCWEFVVEAVNAYIPRRG